MDYLSGGDLRYHICRHRRFTEEITRKHLHFKQNLFTISRSNILTHLALFFIGFFVACLVSGLEYFHEKNIIHRDIKPENLVVETDGKWSIVVLDWASDEIFVVIGIRLRSNYWLWHRACLERRERVRHLWYARLHGARSHVPPEPHYLCRLLRRRSHGLRVHVWTRKLFINQSIEWLWSAELELPHLQ